GQPPRSPGPTAKGAAEAGRPMTRQRLACMALIGVGNTREEGERRADQILDYSRTSGIVATQFMNPPGYTSPAQSAQALKLSGGGFRAGRIQSRDGRAIDPRRMTVAEAIDAGLCFAGTPDGVLDQPRAFYDPVGGFWHLPV